MSNKQKFGQFYTTKYKYILQNFNIPYDKITGLIEPFAGNGDLLEYIDDTTDLIIESFDIDPKKEFIIKQDTLLNVPCYSNRFIITNPPYLARNKSDNKLIFNKYNQNDLYKCFIETIIGTDNNPVGGILIIPLNFFCSIRQIDINLRKRFLYKFNIITLNIFEEQVFDDTSYTICSFQFEPVINNIPNDKINCHIYPNNKNIEISFNHLNNFTIGGEIYSLVQNKDIKVERLTTKNNNANNENITNILVKCIDNSIKNIICMKIVNDNEKYIDNTDKLSARSFCTLVIEPKLNIEQQNQLVFKFNEYLNNQRQKYNSLFLTNFRESKDIARKRISFKLVFKIVNYLLQ